MSRDILSFMKIQEKRLYYAIVLLGLLPTLAIFSWGIYKSLTITTIPRATLFEPMK